MPEERTAWYLVAVRCPNCDDVTRFVREFDEPVPVDQDIGSGAEWCPQCSFWVAGEAEWDLQEETRLHPDFVAADGDGSV